MSKTFAALSKPMVDWLNKLSGWLLLAAIVWLCWGIARIVWLVAAPPQAPNLPLMPLQAKQTANFNASAALAIFEMPRSQQPLNQPPPNVTLSGVMLAFPNSLSSAMLTVNGTMKNYRVGEQLAGTPYTLLEVRWDSVVIADGSRGDIVVDMPERMRLDQSDMNLAANSNTSVPNAMSGFGGGAQPNNQQMGQQYSDNQQDQDNVVGAEAGIDSAINELQQDPANYLGSVGMMATGDGYQVTAAMPEKLRKSLGLEPGDSILSVNGQPVGSNPASDAELMSQVKQTGQATIEIKRGDQTLTLRQQF